MLRQVLLKLLLSVLYLGQSDAQTSIPSSAFGMVWNSQAHLPTVSLGAERLWDVGVTWRDIETSNGVYNWTKLDSRLAQAGTNGYDVLYTLGKVPTWIGGGTSGAAPPSDIGTGDGAFKAFVIALVNHSLASGTHIKFYELWNEPDTRNFWTGTTAQLVTMNNHASSIIHSLDPSASTVGPSPTGKSPDTWLSGWYGAGGTHDIGSYHNSPNVTDSVTNAVKLRTVMNANGDGAKQLWVTEGSWGQVNDAAFTDNQKVAFLGQQYILLENAGVARDYWYAWDNTVGFGPLWDSTNGIHPAGTAYRILYGWMVGSSGLSCTNKAPQLWTCSLTRNGRPARILFLAGTGTTSQSVSAGTFSNFLTLDNTTVNSISGGKVSVGIKPIMLTPGGK